MSAQHTILIVEDDPGFTSYLKRLLRRKDLTLITANSGRLAIQCLNENTVDLVLQDIGLPDIDGYQVMDHIRRKFPETLVIVMTGEITVESAVKALRKGAYDYLRKPFESTELLNTVNNALDRLRLEQQHKEAQEKLRDSEQQFRDLIENSPMCISIIQKGRVVYENMEKSTNGKKRVAIKSSAKNNTLSIQVADSGPGVPIELREKIFDPFFTTKDDGSGMGLNIAQRIVADHNGSISLGSSRWGGAEFKIELPIERRIDAR